MKSNPHPCQGIRVADDLWSGKMRKVSRGQPPLHSRRRAYPGYVSIHARRVTGDENGNKYLTFYEFQFTPVV